MKDLSALKKIVIMVDILDEDGTLLSRSGVAIRVGEDMLDTILDFHEGLAATYRHVTHNLTGKRAIKPLEAKDSDNEG